MTNNKLGYLKTHFASIFVAACAILLARAAWATTWYVDAATGSSSHSGKSMSDAFASIQTAVNVANTNDVVIVNDGTYAPISVAKPLTIKSVNGKSQTIIDGNGSSRCALLWVEDTKWWEWHTNVVLSGFTLQNGYSSTKGGGVKDGTLRDCLIKNCKVAESGRGAGAYCAALFNCRIESNKGLGGYSAGGGAYNCELYNCVVGNNSAPQGGGMMEGYASCSTFFNNKATSFDGGGIKGVYAYSCVVYGNASVQGGGGASYCSLFNCTVVKNSASQGGGSWKSHDIYNAIIWGNSASVDPDVSLTTFRCQYTCSGSLIDGVGNIVSNPNFVNYSACDFRLENDSPCINAGRNYYAQYSFSLNDGYTTKSYSFGRSDVQDEPRIKGKVVDMGAYENQTAYPGAEVGYASAQQRYPWNGLVDITFDVFGLPDNATTNIVMSADGDLLKELSLSTFPEQGLSGLSNGTWNCVWDAESDVSRVLDSNLVVTVALPNNGDQCTTAPTKLDTRSQPRDAAATEDLLIDTDWQTEVSAEDVTATLTQTPPGYKTTKLAEYSGSGVRSYSWNAAAEMVPGVHLFTLTLKNNGTGKVLKTMTSSFTVAGAGGVQQPLFNDDPVQIPQSFSSWDSIGAFLNESRARLMRVDGVTVVPPSSNVVVISLGEFTVPTSMLASLPDTVEPVQEYGVSVYRLHVREIGDGTSGLVAKIGDVPVSELSIPAYNPDRWVEALYGTPPTWLTGEARTRWYAERDISRIEWYMTLVSQSDIADYRANRAAALSEASEERPALALSGLVANASSDALHSLTVNAKEDSVVDVFGKRTLTETNWTYAGRAFIPAGKSAVGVVSDDLSYFMTVVRVADVAEGGGAVVTQGDSDHDGIPDSVETMTYGSNPHSADTSGGGIGDWEKVYVYGLNPTVTDTDGDGYDDIEELMSGTDPKTPAPGADTSIRYFYDDDDQLTRIHFGSHGAMSSVVLSPEGNPKNVKEKAK